jgi:hypothetical protein
VAAAGGGRRAERADQRPSAGVRGAAGEGAAASSCEIDHPVAGKMPTVASPMRFSDTTIEYKLPPPTLGQHTDESVTPAPATG